MNRIIKNGDGQIHYESDDEVISNLTSFVAAYNIAKRLKTLKELTPHEFICNNLDLSQNNSSLTRSMKYPE